ncbi:MAG: hydrogenase expression/formation protein HypE [Planctomycetia bacterium]|nr:hydrogenase expression/formation protein HypE [Planctomycetia bacterium]
MNDSSSWACPVKHAAEPQRVSLAHGEGGSSMRRLLEEHILPRFDRLSSLPLDDAAVLPQIDGRPVLTTDAFVVSPLFFPGGDIGTLSVYGTVNDLAVRGAEPLWLTLSLILEEGFSLQLLDRVLESVAEAARRCRVSVVAGDTKVVPRGAVDRLFVSTTGLGRLIEPGPSGSATIEVGDVLLVSGPIGRHGIAILAAREEMAFEPPPESDCGPLIEAVAALRTAGVRVRAMRDATRGGVTAVMHEWARDCGGTLVIEEERVPISSDVRGVCELLGLDPLNVANEGTMVVAVHPDDAESARSALQCVSVCARAARIGFVRARGLLPVVVKRGIGSERPLLEPSGAPLPRIC